MKMIEGKAKVRVVLEVDADRWGGDCQLDQLYKQAAESALATLRNALKQVHGVRIFGEPEVIGIITEVEK